MITSLDLTNLNKKELKLLYEILSHAEMKPKTTWNQSGSTVSYMDMHYNLDTFEHFLKKLFSQFRTWNSTHGFTGSALDRFAYENTNGIGKIEVQFNEYFFSAMKQTLNI